MNEIKCYKNTPNGLMLVGVVDDYQSFSFTRSYSECGEWQLTLNGSTKNAQLIKEMDYISMDNGICGIVEQLESNVGSNNTITYKGSELKGITNSRIIMPPTGKAYLTIKKNPALVILDILNSQIADCADPNRNIPNVRIDSSIEVDTTQKIEFNGRFSNVYDEIADIATAYNIGWYAAIEQKQSNSQYAEIVFYVYSGVDRKKNQSTNSRFILSYSNDNIEQSNYQYIDTIPNTALIAGQGEGTDRKTYIINNTSAGLGRKEVYIDARDIEDDSLLPQRGKEKLAEYGEANSYQITLSRSLSKQYHSAFELGDIGTIQDDILDLSIDFRLTEITEIYESDDFRLEVVCGYDKKDLGSAIKRSNSNTQTLLKVEGSSGSASIDTAQLLNLVYPVGSIYMAVNNVNPSTLFGGTWEAWGSGRVPVGVDTTDSDFSTVEAVGGEKTHTLTVEEMPTHTHIQDDHTHLQQAHTHIQNPHTHSQEQHTHDMYHQHPVGWTNDGGDLVRISYTAYQSTSRMHEFSYTGNTGGVIAKNLDTTAINQETIGINENTTAVNQSTGGNAEHNILQPYITCYMWKRTA